MCLIDLERLQAASIETYGSYPYTSIPRCVAALATLAPIAPSPITPSFFPAISVPAKFFFSFSAVLAISASALLSRTQLEPPMISREARSIPARTSSLTPFELAPGVLNTTTPSSAYFSIGMLLTPAPARATARSLSDGSISCIEALLTSTASASLTSSVNW